MRHFFVPIEQIADTSLFIAGSDVNHIVNALRMAPGEKFVALDGKGSEYLCAFRSADDERVLADILEKKPVSAELPSKLYLFQGLPKGEKMDFIIQKAVELGVYEVVPVITERTIVRLDTAKAAKKTTRYNAIAESAAKQAGRGIIPKVLAPMTWNAALSYAAELDRVLIPYELERNMEKTKRTLGELKPGESIGVFIGPEGGFAGREVNEAIDMGAVSISLGKRILRTETAGLAILAALMFQMEF